MAGIIDQLKKKFGKDGLFLLEDGEELLTVVKVPTNISTFDAMTGGGIPRGKVIEISGPEGVGKTSFTIAVAKAFLAAFPGMKVAFLDAEGGNDYDFLATKYGLDPSRVIYKRIYSDSAQNVLDMIEFMAGPAGKDEICLIILDSLASLVSDQDSNKDLADGFRDDRPQLYSRHLRRMSRRPNDSCPVIYINQVRMNTAGGPGAEPFYEPGGMGVRHYPSLRVRLFRAGTVKEGDLVTGFKVSARAHKARYSIPRSTCEWIIDYEKGVSTTRSLVDQGLIQGVIGRKGAAYYIFAEQQFHGLKNLIEALDSKPKLLAQLAEAVVFEETGE